MDKINVFTQKKKKNLQIDSTKLQNENDHNG